MSARPLVSVYNCDDASVVSKNSVTLPTVFTAPIRLDIVSFVHKNLSKNTRQAHGVKKEAGMQHSAESWGTGRAVARIPRVSGSGTHRAGQAAFGNMCRKGRMFAPLKVYRRWHRKVNVNQRRHAVASALAASVLTPLVMARGHKVAQVPEFPLVVEDKLESYEKTKEAVAFLKRFGAYEDVQKVVSTKAMRAGKGKLRNKRFKTRKGPLVVYSNENVKLVQAFRNVPGVEVANVNRLNLRQLAPGGQVGRFCVFTQSAFAALDGLFGSYKQTATAKTGYQLQRQTMTNADLARLVNSNEVQSVVRPVRNNVCDHEIQKKNPLKNKKMMERLNPNSTLVRETARKANEANRKKRQDAVNSKRGVSKSLSAQDKKSLKQRKAASRQWIQGVLKNLDESYKRDYEHNAHLTRVQRGIDSEEENEE